ncbi:MAG: polyprenol monophosphomannose synthase [Microbacteriaceae bacterium]
MTKALVVIPTYNERENLESIVSRLRAQSTVDILIVDDNSPDGTGGLADSLAATVDGVNAVNRPHKQGLGPAYIAGFEWAFERGYELVAEMDADGSHDPAVVPVLIEIAATTGAELVIGSRWVRGGRIEGWSRIREAISRTGNTYARFALGSRVHDLTAGFRVIRTDTLRALDLSSISSSGYCFQIEVAHRIEQSGGTIIEHPITFREREAGVSKMNVGIVVEALARITGWGIARLFRR